MSEIDPTEISVVGRRSSQEKFSQDLPDVPPVVPPSTKAEREGLPSGYRMRADAHYVDQLTSRRAEKGERAEATRQNVDAPEEDGRDRRSDRVFAQLQEEIASIASAAAMLSADASPLGRRLSVDLIRAQTWRAAWLVRAHALVEGRERGQFRSKPLSSILEQLRQGLAPECRLAGISLRVHATDWNVSVSVDESALIAGITGAVIATLGVVGQSEGASVRIHVDASGPDIRTIEVAQDDVTAGPTVGLRFFDLSWADRPGGWTAGLGALAARAAAQQHGGNAAIVLGDRRGTTIRMSLARSH